LPRLLRIVHTATFALRVLKKHKIKGRKILFYSEKISMKMQRGFLASLFLFACLCACGKKPAAVSPPPTGFLQKSQDGTLSLNIQPWPARTGNATLTVQLLDSNEKPINSAKVKIAFSMPDMAMKGPTVALIANGKDGTYTGTVNFSMATTWKAEVTAEIPEKNPLVADFSIKVPY